KSMKIYRRLEEKLVNLTKRGRNEASGCELAYNLRKQFLDFHNQKREDLAKGRVFGFNPAKNMYKLSWSCELESKARHHIRNCPGTMHGFGSNGANSWRFYGGRFGQPQQFIQQTLDTWWKNVQKYRLGPDNRYPSHGSLYNVANVSKHS
ncbi:SCP-like protein, partial [Ancylostoma caninum]